ncbi:reverse transcriptase [Danaus plexippus plexippus]|uniref:Reverse transcriptase n=1 Tax=Danaus plexippus plexippus TaxID=278856 RepID=A0A212F5L0_DANPL|nr:reverse transcriptase [Danaus plexippus plexippus]
MAGRLRFLKANGNHCAGAQDLFLQSMVKWAVDVAVMSEPLGAVPPLAVRARGHGYVAAVRGEITIVGVCFSPNRDLPAFERFLDSLEPVVGQLAPLQVVVMGDLNAKSTAWGNPHTKPKGRELEEWALTAELSLLNTGTVQTCVRRSGGSVVDVSFATPTIARRVEGWRVEVGVETLSDHRYIRFEVSATPAGRRSPASSSSSSRERSRFPRWALSRLNRELAEEAAVVGRWSLPGSAELGVDEGASRFGDVLHNVCRAAMPPIGRRPPRVRMETVWKAIK